MARASADGVAWCVMMLVLFLCMVQEGGFWDYKINFIQLTVSLFQGSHNLKQYKDLLMFWGLRWWRISPHRQKSQSSGCFFKRDFGERSLLKLRNFKTSIRICLCFEGCGGDSFHQIAKKNQSSGCFFQLVFGEWALMMQRRFSKDKGIAYVFY